jgi:hypothetical protein
MCLVRAHANLQRQYATPCLPALPHNLPRCLSHKVRRVQDEAKQGEDAIRVRQPQPMHAGAMVRVGQEVHEQGLITRHVQHLLWFAHAHWQNLYVPGPVDE